MQVLNKLLLLGFFLPGIHSIGQVIENEELLENQARNEEEMADETLATELHHFKRNPIDINEATIVELRALKIISDLQIAHFITYRQLAGQFADIHELQAIPTWDLLMIRKLLPYIRLGDHTSIRDGTKARLKGGEHMVLGRWTRMLQAANGFLDSGAYAGSRDRILLRHTYRYRDLLMYGFTAEKDAGEKFKISTSGFDFYSFHFFARKIRSIKALAIGDFTVNLGQGLIHWQSMTASKGGDVITVKQQSEVLNPYRSTSEYNFKRGIGVTFKKGNWESTVYASLLRRSANEVIDSVGKRLITSLTTSGLHRTEQEWADRKNTAHYSGGVNLVRTFHKGRVGVNGSWNKLSMPLLKGNRSYEFYSLEGERWFHFSLDYAYTFQNIHFFGEAAMSGDRVPAFITGMMMSVDPRVDLALVFRKIDPGFRTLQGNAFTETSYPANETGIYSALVIRPSHRVQLSMYADLYRFPFLRYRVGGPSHGKDLLVQVKYQPDRKTEVYARFRSEQKMQNVSGEIRGLPALGSLEKNSLRLHFSHIISIRSQVRGRTEFTIYNKDNNEEHGFLAYLEWSERILERFRMGLRAQVFEATSFDSRIYAYESDVLFAHSIPSFFDEGWRYYLVGKIDLGKNTNLDLKWSETLYPGKRETGTGTDRIKGNKRSELRLQLVVNF